LAAAPAWGAGSRVMQGTSGINPPADEADERFLGRLHQLLPALLCPRRDTSRRSVRVPLLRGLRDMRGSGDIVGAIAFDCTTGRMARALWRRSTRWGRPAGRPAAGGSLRSKALADVAAKGPLRCRQCKSARRGTARGKGIVRLGATARLRLRDCDSTRSLLSGRFLARAATSCVVTLGQTTRRCSSRRPCTHRHPCSTDLAPPATPRQPGHVTSNFAPAIGESI
jgi:hypothetical protein